MSTNKIEIHSKAPIRIDLAGGTVDIWPLYLLLKDPVTINLAIDLFAETFLSVEKVKEGSEVILESGDLNLKVKTTTLALMNDEFQKELQIHQRLLGHFLKHLPPSQAKTLKIHLKTIATSPAGAGLGGSSGLSISIIGALNMWVKGSLGKEPDKVHLIETTKDIESQVLRVPAGLQDYYGAMFGGLQKINWQAGTHSRDELSTDVLSELGQRLILFYSGLSRNSGINNWSLFKSFVDGDVETQNKFSKIVEATHELGLALENQNWSAVGEAIRKEWTTRRTLADGITTPLIDEAFETAMKEGASAAKICGAGGGGCFFVYLDEPSSEKSQRIKKAVTDQAKGKICALDFLPVQEGLTTWQKK